MVTLKSKPFCVALTGGIGSGKTTAAHFFAALGVPIIDADQIAHQLTEKNQPAYQEIVTHFGKQILHQDRAIDRNKLRQIIFENTVEKTWLENLLHPLIRNTMKKQIQQITYPYCICIIPLLAETKPIDFIHRVLVINAPEDLQIKRVAVRDASDSQIIKKIIQAQATSESRLAIADDIIQNTGDLSRLKKQIDELHEQYRRMATEPRT